MGIMYQAMSAQVEKLKGCGAAAIRARINVRAQEQEDDWN